ncbi:MAG: hypothetical protein NC489_36815 [Ruminococcus flavefaciens]|nr:hypothetical protein [Ruminococcus flavefaciens]
MGNVLQDADVADNKAAMETLISCLDKGIDDVEAGRVHTAGEAFQLIRDRVNPEVKNTSVR